MNIGFVGLGKLGLTCALGMEAKGHAVLGCDPSPLTAQVLETGRMHYLEEGAEPLLEQTRIRLVDVDALVRHAEILFVAVQTPHAPRFEGVTPIPAEREDFDYGYLCEAVRAVSDACTRANVVRTVVVISTVIPGGFARYVTPCADPQHTRLVYNPFFIAMGTTLADFLAPEFVLVGTSDAEALAQLVAFYGTIHDRPLFPTTIENAEVTKTAYNTFIGLKIAFANTLLEMCTRLPNTNCDTVVDALSLASDRLISPRYLRGGMGDGGGCHPRDNIALSWLAKKLGLSHNLFEDAMAAREDQTAWLADVLVEESKGTQLPIVLMGRAFKPGTNIETGSPARLLSYILNTRRIDHDCYEPHDAYRDDSLTKRPSLFFLSTRHQDWKTFPFPAGSIVIDPFRYARANPSLAACTYKALGVGPRA